jgi:hypothetical protein
MGCLSEIAAVTRLTYLSGSYQLHAPHSRSAMVRRSVFDLREHGWAWILGQILPSEPDVFYWTRRLR